MLFEHQIIENNKTHTVTDEELNSLISESSNVYSENFDSSVHFERSLFINWTCAIADCKYCYLSTKPKLARNALRSHASILAEAFVLNEMGIKIGYITGGLRVEKTEYLVDLMKKINEVLGYKVQMNFGPYIKQEIVAFKPYISGMGCAIESFDEELHSFICPSKPLKNLMNTLQILKEEKIPSFITIILGMGEKKSDVEEVIQKVSEYGISCVQLCFLKPIAGTVFAETPPPDPKYMAYWISKIRIAHPKIKIKIALVKECMDEFGLLLKAGANCFSRHMVFRDFELGKKLVSEAEKAGRKLEGHFTSLPDIDFDTIDSFSFDKKLKEQMKEKAQQYFEKLDQS